MFATVTDRRLVRASLLVLVSALMLVAGACSSGRPSPSALEKGPWQHLRMARVHFERGEAKRALEEIEAAHRVDDSVPQVHFYEGFIRWSMREWPAAETAFRRTIELNPLHLDARMYLASTLEEQGEPEAALDALDAALALPSASNLEQVMLNKALVLKRMGRTGEALSELRRAVGLRPRYHRAHYEMALILEELNRPREMLDALDAAAPGYDEDAEFFYRRGAAHFRLSKPERAREDLRRAIDLAPGSETARRARELLEVMG